MKMVMLILMHGVLGKCEYRPVCGGTGGFRRSLRLQKDLLEQVLVVRVRTSITIRVVYYGSTSTVP